MTEKTKASDKPMSLDDVDLEDVNGGGMAVKGDKISAGYETKEVLVPEETRIVMSGGSTMYEGVVAKSEK